VTPHTNDVKRSATAHTVAEHAAESGAKAATSAPSPSAVAFGLAAHSAGPGVPIGLREQYFGPPAADAARDGEIRIGERNDPLESEAARTADAIAGGPGLDSSILGRVASDASSGSMPNAPAPPSVHDAITSSGCPLDQSVRREMETHLHADLSSVRVHADPEQGASARDVDANAYTVGSHIVFAPGEYAPDTMSGKHLLAHELTHVVQQMAPGGASGAASRVARRDDKPARARGKPEPKTAPAKAPAAQWVYGEVVLKGKAIDDLLHSQSIFPSEDNTHLAVDGRGKLGYDASYTTPADSFRWQKLKDVVDAKQKITVERVDLTQTIPSRFITSAKTSDIETTLRDRGAEGITFPTEAIQRKAYPTGPIETSRSADTSAIFYTLALSSASAGPLAHELFGHMWLALQGVPSVHPKESDKQAVKDRGTLESKHGVKTPFGSTYTGTVREYIDRYVGSKFLSTAVSPTLLIGSVPLAHALAELRANFAKKASGTLNGTWAVPDDMATHLDVLARNWVMLAYEPTPTDLERATASAPRTQADLEQELTAWYTTLSPGLQYALLSFFDKARWEVKRETGLFSRLLGSLPKPKGMP
jgi:hypothetical protein